VLELKTRWTDGGRFHEQHQICRWGAFDEGGAVFMNRKSRSLDGAMAALEKGLAAWFEENE
jgi:hypothetical protein